MMMEFESSTYHQLELIIMYVFYIIFLTDNLFKTDDLRFFNKLLQIISIISFISYVRNRFKLNFGRF